MAQSERCKICQGLTKLVGIRKGEYIAADFELRQCPTCHFAFIANPYPTLEELYGSDYYSGKGADPLVDYEFEVHHPELTIRQYEWLGIERIVRDCVPVDAATRWLDFGCGTGGLVRYCHDHIKCKAFGYETSDIQGYLRDLGESLITDKTVGSYYETFDVITAIEVLEHVQDPVATLRLLRSLLKRDGLLFCTTGNAEPHRNRILEWRYLIPEIHISLFEPFTLETALKIAGFRPEYAGFSPGFEDIIRFKILKNLGIRRTSLWERILPWKILSRTANCISKVSAHPRGWAV